MQLAKEFSERLERLARLVEAAETRESAEPKLSLIEEFKQKYPNAPVPGFLRYAASLPPSPQTEDDKQADDENHRGL